MEKGLEGRQAGGSSNPGYKSYVCCGVEGGSVSQTKAMAIGVDMGKAFLNNFLKMYKNVIIED